MSETASITGVAAALLLPWFMGSTLVAWLLRGTQQRCKWVVLGHGFFVGTLGTTLLLRVFDALGMLDSFAIMATIMAFVGVVAAVAASRSTPGLPRPAAPARQVTPRWQLAIVALLAAWVALRYGLMARELTLRPLFAWDAWMNWAPRAITWYQLGELAPFVHPHDWHEPGNAGAYTLGNWVASDYPPGVPLVLTWFMLGADSWNNSLVYLAWLAAPIALGMSLYGHLRLAGMPLFAAVIVAYLVLSLPFLNVHTVLAGYADVWLAGSFSMAVFALREWRLTRERAWAVLFLTMLVLCTQLKNPGILLAMILATFGLRELVRLPARVELGAVAIAIVLITVVAGLGTKIPLPMVGTVSYSDGMLEAGYIGTYEVKLHAQVWNSVLTSFFFAINWNLVFYAVPPLLLVLVWQRRRSFAIPPTEVLALVACAAFLAFAFFFTDRSKGAINFSTLNRAILYLVPATVFSLAVGLMGPRDSAGGERDGARGKQESAGGEQKNAGP